MNIQISFWTPRRELRSDTLISSRLQLNSSDLLEGWRSALPWQLTCITGRPEVSSSATRTSAGLPGVFFHAGNVLAVPYGHAQTTAAPAALTSHIITDSAQATEDFFIIFFSSAPGLNISRVRLNPWPLDVPPCCHLTGSYGGGIMSRHMSHPLVVWVSEGRGRTGKAFRWPF